MPLLETFVDDPAVGEVVVGNNVAKPIPFRHRKLVVLDQTENIFVNPAWNLGVSVATGHYVLVSNDDIGLRCDVVTTLVSIVRLAWASSVPTPS